MLKQNLFQNNYVNLGRLFQALFLLLAIWSFYWGHIYEMFVWNKTFIETMHSSVYHVLLYSLSIFVIFSFEMYLRRSHRVSTTSSQSVESTLVVNEFLNNKPVNFQEKPSKKIGGMLIVFGTLLLLSSFLINSTILSFIGLGLTFWGALLLYVRKTDFVPNTIVNASVVPSYVTIDRIISDLNCTGRSMYVPPYPKDSYLPEYLSGIKDLVVFIFADKSMAHPPIEAIGQKRFMVKNPKGICITPPGSGLIDLFEKELKLDFSKIDQERFYEYLPNLIVNVLELASKIEINDESGLIRIKVTNSVYRSLYSNEQNLTSILSIGCPLISAIACGLAKTTGKFVVIEKYNISFNLQNVEFWYRIVEG